MVTEIIKTIYELVAKLEKQYPGRHFTPNGHRADSHGVAQYHFSCSLDQLFLYFRRFNPGGIKILNSDSLNMDLLRFHSRHVAELEKQGYYLEEK